MLQSGEQCGEVTSVYTNIPVLGGMASQIPHTLATVDQYTSPNWYLCLFRKVCRHARQGDLQDIKTRGLGVYQYRFPVR